MTTDMFLKLGDIKGESIDSKYKNAIHVDSMSWNIDQGTANHSGSGGSSGRVEVGSIVLHKALDSSSPALRALCSQGMVFPEAFVVKRKAGGKVPLEYYRLTIKNVLISSLHLHLGSEGQPDTEILALSFTEFVEEYVPQNAEGSGNAAIRHGFNITKHSKI
jgi:type VI secretion system secreted protein Hcp